MSSSVLKGILLGFKAGGSAMGLPTILAAAGVVTTLIGGAYIWGRIDQSSVCNVASLEQKVKSLETALEGARVIISKHAKSLQVDQKTNIENEGIINATPDNDNACLGAPAAGRVRRIRG